MIEPKFDLDQEAWMMYDNRPVKVFVVERLFIRREYMSKYGERDLNTFEYIEYKVCGRWSVDIRVNEKELFHTKEELLKSFD